MKLFFLFITAAAVVLSACNEERPPTAEAEFQYQTEQFGDVRMLRYRVPGFEELTTEQKEMLYYLAEAALSGRDILWDQNFKHNLVIRRTLEAIINHYNGNRSSDEFQKFLVYTKLVWFSYGIHHHHSTMKIIPEFSREYFRELIKNSPNAEFPLREGETPEAFIERLIPIMFDPDIAAKRVNLDPGVDMIQASANNYYEGVTQEEVEAFYREKIDQSDPRPISYGLNSKLVKEGGRIIEKTWKVGGMYSEAIEKIVFWLEKALSVAENQAQKTSLEKLIEYYQTGDLRTFDEYSIAWVQDTTSLIDVVNGFIEVYGDPLGYRGAFESVVSFKDREATRRIAAIGNQAQWFEDHAPIMEEHKKKNVTGISAKVITVVMESGDVCPSVTIGINLPNPDWIRAQFGSKSVTLGNIIHAVNEADKNSGINEEFLYSAEQIERTKKYSRLAYDLHTDMHEVIGHASGKLNPGVGTPVETLKSYASTLEEARADLLALYFLLDPKLLEIGVMPSLDAGKVGYDKYILNGLMLQLRRLKAGEQLEESHMRNRQLVSQWAYEHGKSDYVIEKKVRDGKTYFVINDYQKLRTLFGELLREIQRIKSEGDYEAGKELVETYGVRVDPRLHREVRERFGKLHIAPYSGFI